MTATLVVSAASFVLLRKPRNQEVQKEFLVSWFPYQTVFKPFSGISDLRGKKFWFCQPQLGQSELHPDVQTAETILAASLEIDGRRLFEILRRAAHLADGETVPQNLCDHLIVENKIVRVPRQIRLQLLQQRPRECPVAGVIF